MHEAGSVPAELYELCFQSGATPALIVNRTSLFIYRFNQAFVRLLGKAPDENSPLTELFEFDDSLVDFSPKNTGQLKPLALPCHFCLSPLGETYFLLECFPMDAESQRDYEHFKQLNQRKNELIANISHELRTPLTAILGWPEIILDSGDMPGLAVQAAEAIRKDGSFLRELLEDLIDISKIDSGKLDLIPEEEELNQILIDAHDILAEQAHQKKQDLRLILPEQILLAHVDRIRIMQIVVNYLSNAIKYTKHGGQIEMQLSLHGDEAWISVSDNGIGIDDKLKELVFERYVRADEVKTQRGVGIGLALVSKLAQLHQGRCWVESEKGEGSQFFLALPAWALEEPMESVPLPETDYKSLKELRLLLLASDPAEAMLIEKLLQSHVREIRSHSIWVDAPLPEHDLCLVVTSLGEEKNQYLKQFHEINTTPTIALSASAMKGDREQLLELGYHAVLSKPFLKKDLLQCIQQIWMGQLHV